MPPTIEDKTDTDKPVDTQNPANDIYKVPINIHHWAECHEGRPLHGLQESTTLGEGSTPEEARASLKSYLGYLENWLKLSFEERKRISPFELRDLRQGEIEKIPSCSRRYKNKRGEYTCGRALHTIPDNADRDNELINGNGEFGMCVLMNYDVPEFEDCPYNKR